MIEMLTPKGHSARYTVRDGTSDGALVAGIVGEDEYGLMTLPPLDGWAIDIGAHIGTVAVTLATDHPGLRIVAVEALPDNVAFLCANILANHLEARIFVESAAAASERETEPVAITYDWTDDASGYWHDNRFIGGMLHEGRHRAWAEPLSLGRILARHRIDQVTLLKIDCEGCEWFFLDSPEISRVDLVIGEMHAGRHGNRERLVELLSPTHEIEWLDDNLVVGHFRAVRR